MDITWETAWENPWIWGRLCKYPYGKTYGNSLGKPTWETIYKMPIWVKYGNNLGKPMWGKYRNAHMGITWEQPGKTHMGKICKYPYGKPMGITWANTHGKHI